MIQKDDVIEDEEIEGKECPYCKEKGNIIPGSGCEVCLACGYSPCASA